MTLDQLILECLPGTGREIAEKVWDRKDDHPDAIMVTPNVVYAVMLRRPHSTKVRRKMVDRDGKLVQYFELKGGK